MCTETYRTITGYATDCLYSSGETLPSAAPPPPSAWMKCHPNVDSQKPLTTEKFEMQEPWLLYSVAKFVLNSHDFIVYCRKCLYII